MNIWGRILKLCGWRADITVEHRDKCVICVAPHTSNLDFLMGLIAYRSYGYRANFLMKKFWFFWPLGCLMRALGGIPVDRKKKGGISLTDAIIGDFKHRDYLNLAVTPEGTRSRTSKWRTGFLYMAYGAGVPIQLGVIDFGQKRILIEREYHPMGEVEKDMEEIKKYYNGFPDAAKHPEKFTV